MAVSDQLITDDFAIYCGDCVEVMQAERVMEIMREVLR